MKDVKTLVVDLTRNRMIFGVWDVKRHLFPAKFPHSLILHYACRSLLTENNGKNNTTAVRLCAVFVFLGGETKD